MKQHLLTLTLLLWTIPIGATPLEFRGLFQTERGESYYLTDPQTSESSGWIPVGGRFRGYQIIEYKPTNRLLVLDNEGRQITLPFADYASSSIGRSLVRTLRIGGSDSPFERDIVLADGVESEIEITPGQTLILTSLALGDGTIAYYMSVERVEADDFQFASAPVVVAFPDQPFDLLLDNLKIELTP